MKIETSILDLEYLLLKIKETEKQRVENNYSYETFMWNDCQVLISSVNDVQIEMIE